MNKKMVYFGGGGLNGLNWFANSKEIEKLDLTNTDFYGSSAGSIYAAGCLLYGRQNFNKKINELCSENPLQIPSFYFRLFKMGKGNFPKNLHIVAWDILNLKISIIDFNSGYSVTKACRASSAIPILLPPVLDAKKKHLYVDGCVFGESKILKSLPYYEEKILIMPLLNNKMIEDERTLYTHSTIIRPSETGRIKILKDDSNLIKKGISLINPLEINAFDRQDYSLTLPF